MAPNTIPRAAIFSFLVLLAIFPSLEAAKSLKKFKETNMVFYMQDWESGANVTSVSISGIKQRPTVLDFGTLNSIDDALTQDLDRNSTQIGRAQGMYVNSALDGSNLHFVMSFVFTNKEYNGSTLEIQGADRVFLKYREVSVVSGTGKFRFARGYVTLETVYLDLKSLDAVLRCNLTVLHY